MTTPLFPNLVEYTLDHRCPVCRAEPGEPCDAPNKISVAARHHDPDPIHLLHAARQDRGIAHYRRDIGRAPWPEDRVPGVGYGTLRHTFAHWPAVAP